MAKTNSVLATAVETYLTDLRQILGSGGATAELSTYLPLGNLLNAVGATLKPKITCGIHPADQGAGFPDLGLYSATQIQRGQPRTRPLPEHGAVEMKPPTDDAWVTTDGPQVSRYQNRYQLVLVTNTRDFMLVDAALHQRDGVPDGLNILLPHFSQPGEDHAY